MTAADSRSVTAAAGSDTAAAEAADTAYGFNDMPATEDALGLDRYFEGLSAFIMNCPTPMTIAIQGGWGSGKTSAMKMVRKRIEDHEDHDELIQIEFNTWQYARIAGPDLFLPLLRRMSAVIREEIKKKAKNKGAVKRALEDRMKKLDDAVAGLTGALVTVGKGAIEAVTGAGNTLSDLQDKAQRAPDYTEKAGLIYDYIDQLKKQLDEEIAFLEKKLGVRRIVLYVDDLDRLGPEEAVGFLEDLKNFVECDNCVFVLALDHEIVRRGLWKKYNFESEKVGTEYASRFFDKLIKLPFNLPCHQYDIEQYLGSLLGENEEKQEFAGIIRAFGDTNPRSIKRLFNIFRMYEHIGGQPYEGHRSELLALLLLQLNHEGLYRQLLHAMQQDLSDPEVSMLRTFGDPRTPYRHVEAWFSGAREEGQEPLDDRDADVVRALKDLFMPDGAGNADAADIPGSAGRPACADRRGLLFDIVGATVITGDGTFDARQRIEEIRKLIKDYLNFLNYLEYRRTGKDEEYRCGSGGAGSAGGITVGISVPLPDHINLNIMGAAELCHDSEADRVAFFRERLLPEEDFAVLPVWRSWDHAEMDILYTDRGMCCLRGISISDSRSMRLTGRILRSIAETGRIFPGE